MAKLDKRNPQLWRWRATIVIADDSSARVFGLYQWLTCPPRTSPTKTLTQAFKVQLWIAIIPVQGHEGTYCLAHYHSKRHSFQPCQAYTETPTLTNVTPLASNDRPSVVVSQSMTINGSKQLTQYRLQHGPMGYVPRVMQSEMGFETQNLWIWQKIDV